MLLFPKNEHFVEDRGRSHQTTIIACAVATWSVAAAFVGMRFYTRRWLLNVIAAEDWVIVGALVFSAAESAGFIEQTAYGLGRHMSGISNENLVKLNRAGWYSILWYSLTLCLTKTSILLLYIRILTYDWVRRAAHLLLASVLVTNAWTFAVVMSACVPLRAFWDPSVSPVYCHGQSFYWASTGMHMGTDFLICLLPMPVIVAMRVRWRQKLLLYCIFAFGFFVCVVSIIRLLCLIAQNSKKDTTYDNLAIPIWTCIEVNTAIVCACVMTLKPLATKLLGRRSKPRRRPVPSQQVALSEGHPPTIGSKPAKFFQARQDSSWIEVPGRVHSDVRNLDEDEDEGVSVKPRDLEVHIMLDKDMPSSIPSAHVREVQSPAGP
ncbi:hypothetical protein NKR23_g6266 [Pleurostoma richardsiae]|uniref:Rhodopsin domain-containing protein n=1 Tax=Pleurostoma richardsiae TaxID=41990 RepID=A0AA38RQW5_9PEZI|nr:hypothetical protein NKR23_g6266 [Pleurostoma richardsiae]